MVSTSGSRLLPESAITELRTRLLPLTTVLTPNIPEARLLLKDAGVDTEEPDDVDSLIQLTKQLSSLGPRAVLLKGGHLALADDRTVAHDHQRDSSFVVDILFDGEEIILFKTDYLVSKNTHGTGCSLASAIAANLASGKSMKQSVQNAVRFVEAGIKTSPDLGKGSGPINHFHSVYTLPFAPYVTPVLLKCPLVPSGFRLTKRSGRFLEYVLDRPDVQPVWKHFTEHVFVKGIANGSLPEGRFKHYLVQDYLYLVCPPIQHKFMWHYI